MKVLEPFYWQAFIKTGLVSSIVELRDEVVKTRRGVFPGITVVKCFFENDSFATETLRRDLKLKKRFMDTDRSVLKLAPKGSSPVFIHIRHGDFVGVFSGGYSIQLTGS